MSNQRSENVLSFGSFQFDAQQRQLLEGSRPLHLGSRALDILAILIENAGAIVSKETLIKRVWPTTVVEDINLRVHISAIRRALGDGLNGRRYITNVPQRGYSFVGVVQPAGTPELQLAATPKRTHNLPLRLSPVFGLEQPVQNVRALLRAHRLVTVVGPGGSGKSTLVHQTAEQELNAFCDGVFRLDLSDLRAPGQLLPLLAEVLRLHIADTCRLDWLCAQLREQQILLIIDNADYLLEAAAHLIESLLRNTAVRVLASCREPLLASGERVYRTEPLAYPQMDAAQDLGSATRYPAVAMFLNRWNNQGRALDAQDTLAVCQICERLEGLPLAIELAALNAELLGLGGVLHELDTGGALRLSGRRTAEPRHKALSACLDWSYDMLEPTEQQIFQRLALFAEPFTLNMAVDLVISDQIEEAQVFRAITQLAGKSLFSVLLVDHIVRYQWQGMSRLYALEKLHHQAGSAD